MHFRAYRVILFKRRGIQTLYFVDTITPCAVYGTFEGWEFPAITFNLIFCYSEILILILTAFVNIIK